MPGRLVNTALLGYISSMNPNPTEKPVVLMIMDGLGYREAEANNAVRLARTPNLDRLMATVPMSFLQASGPAVGLPAGQVGNSEVGHLTIGAGRVIQQDLARIDAAVADASINRLPLLDSLAETMSGAATVQLMGLVSDGGVHSRAEHLLALAKALTERHLRVAIHAFTDGRDTLPKLAGQFLPAFADRLPEGAVLASISGRYFAMDRDHRWERTLKAWQAITHGTAEYHAKDAATAIHNAYARGETDEFISPTVLSGYQPFAAGDALVMANFRADRVRQLLGLYAEPALAAEHSVAAPDLSALVGMVPYAENLDAVMQPLFAPQQISDTLGQVVAAAGLSQLRLAETEKYPHVTFFLNAGEEKPAIGEDRQLIASPKVATYDLKPEMSAEGVLASLLEAIRSRRHDLIIVNFANPDMVGHTGDLAAAIRAVEVTDAAVGDAVAALSQAGGVMLLTADHGNCEMMWDDKAESPHTAHTTNPVPLLLVGGQDGMLLADGGLADLAPTLLRLLGLAPPPAMTGRNLISTGG